MLTLSYNIRGFKPLYRKKQRVVGLIIKSWTGIFFICILVFQSSVLPKPKTRRNYHLWKDRNSAQNNVANAISKSGKKTALRLQIYEIQNEFKELTNCILHLRYFYQQNLQRVSYRYSWRISIKMSFTEILKKRRSERAWNADKIYLCEDEIWSNRLENRKQKLKDVNGYLCMKAETRGYKKSNSCGLGL